MKFRTTKKAINNGYNNRVCVGYCHLQGLLRYEDPAAYTVRVEGWAADIYDFGENAIITGSAPFGNIKVSYDICQKYEQAARELHDQYLDYEDEKTALQELINQFLEEVIK